MTKISERDVIEFIIINHEDTEVMNKINRVTFPFTSRYLRGPTEPPTPEEVDQYMKDHPE